MAIYMQWVHKSVDNEWWYNFVIGDVTHELFIQNKSIEVYLAVNACEDQVALIKAWIATFSGFERGEPIINRTFLSNGMFVE